MKESERAAEDAGPIPKRMRERERARRQGKRESGGDRSSERGSDRTQERVRVTVRQRAGNSDLTQRRSEKARKRRVDQRGPQRERG